MCDYSLHSVKSRSAKVGDKLTTRDFGTGTRGFAPSEDASVAVCVLPGTELAFAQEVKRLPDKLWPWHDRVIKHKTAIFRQINKDKFAAHHDALEFPDGQVVLLTSPYGYGHMIWGGPGWGWHPFFIIGPIFALLAIVGIMAIFVWLVRWATRGYPFYGHGHHFHGGCPWCGGPGRSRIALDILDERFAKGEIEKAEFEEKRKLLSR